MCKGNIFTTAQRRVTLVALLLLALLLAPGVGWGQTTLAKFQFESTLNADAGSVGNPSLTATGFNYTSSGLGNPGRAIYTSSDGYYIDLTISTVGYTNVKVTWDGTSSNNSNAGSWTLKSNDGTGLSGVLYTQTLSKNTFSTVPAQALGATFDNNPNVEIRIVSNNTGGRTLRLDNLKIQGTPIPPIVTITPATLDFGFTPSGTTSSNQTSTLSGLYLTGNLTITAPSNFEVSTNPSSGFGSSITVSPTGGAINNVPIYVRFKPTAPNTDYLNKNVTISGGGLAAAQNVVVSGTSVSTAPIFYSYQSGSWNTSTTWTTDPSGTTQVGSTIPGDNDIVVILPNRTVTLPGDVATSGLKVSINEGGFLDLSTYKFTAGLGSLGGQGTMRIASVYFPTVATNNFVLAGGGTTEYTAGITLPSQATYCNLKINAGSGTVLQPINLTLNGNLYVKTGTFQINDATARRLQLNIAGSVTVDAGATIKVGTGATNNAVTNPLGITGGTAPFISYYDAYSHRIVVNGDFTNHGTVRFTNQPYPVYNAFPSDGFATVYFRGANNSSLICGGTTDFYNLVLDKGIDQTFKLTVYTSGSYKNFRLFGANISDGDGGGANPNLKKALWIRTGTLVLEGTTVIPSLTEGATASGSPNSDFYIPANGALVVNGIDVVVQTTADDYREVNAAYGTTASSNDDMGISTGGSGSSLGLYGKLQMDDGYLTTKESGGIITSSIASGQLVINKGTLDTKQFLSLTGAASFEQNGGLFTLRGRFQRTPSAYSSVSDLLNAPLNTVRANDASLKTTAGAFNINNANNIFIMTGGTMRIYDVCGTVDPSYALQINSSEANSNVTGGIIEFAPTAGTGVSADAANHLISTTSPLGNVTINRTSGSSIVQLANALKILNNLSISSGELNANNFDVTVGGDVTVASNTKYTTGSNTTTLNGSGPQTFTVDLATPLSLNKFTIDKASGVAVTFAGTQKTINVADNFRLALGTLNDNGNTINLAKDVYNSGIHSGAGKIVLNGTVAQAIDGNGVFQNLDLNNTTAANAAPVSLAANTTIKGVLNLVSNKIFNIASHNLNIASTGSIAATAFSSSCYIHTNGQSGDGGITKAYTSNTPFTFPVGCFSTKRAVAYAYTPAAIGFSSNPTTYGSITVAPVGYEHPATTANGKSLTFYWRVKSTGFSGYNGKVTHSFVYSPTDVAGTKENYIPTYYNRTEYSWNNGVNANINTGTSTISDWASPANSSNVIDADYTAGDAAFGTTTKFYSIAGTALTPADWSSNTTWSKTSGGVAVAPGSVAGVNYPGPNSIVVIENNHYVTLSVNASCASLQIASGSVLDIKNYTGSNFGMVLSSTGGNGLFRLHETNITPSVYVFPLGDFSDFNVNKGTTEFYTNSIGSSDLYILPANVTSYGNLILSPSGAANLSLPNNSLTTIYGDFTCNSPQANSWIAMSWNTSNSPWNNSGLFGTTIEKTVHVVGNLYVKGGTLIYMNDYQPQHLIVDGDVTVGTTTSSTTGAGIYVLDWGGWVGNNSSVANTLAIGGSLINNSNNSSYDGIYLNGSGYYVDVTFFGSKSAFIENTIANTPNTYFRNVTVNKGSSQATTLTCNIGGTLYTPTDSWLTLQNGTFIHDRPSKDFTISEGTKFTIPSTAGLTITNAANVYLANSASSTSNDVYLNGKLTVQNGNVYVGPSNGTTNRNNDIEYSGGGASEIEVQGGALVVNGQIRRNPVVTNGVLTYTQRGGAVTINGNAANSTNAKLEVLNTGSSFNMSGGTLNIIRGGGGTTYGDLYLRPASSSVTGGTIVFSNSSLNGSPQSYLLDASIPLNNLTITGRSTATTANATVKLMVNPLVLNGNLTLTNAQSIFDANTTFNIGVTVKGDFTNNGTYNHYSNTTTFNGGVQSLLGTSATDFYNLTVSPVTSLTLGGTHPTLSGTITVNNNINLASGSLICGANKVYVKGDVVNNATYTNSNSASGFVLNGSSQQHISGTGRFGQLELDNLNGSTLDNGILLTKDLVLTNGIFDINQYLLTLDENSNIVEKGTPFGVSKMITSDGVWSNVGISKVFPVISSSTPFTYPLGSPGKYTPAKLTITANGRVGSIRINNINSHHPAVIDPNNVLQYYWEVESTGISGFTGNLLLSYKATDVKGGPESSYIAAQLLMPGTNWSKFGTDKVDETNHTITFNYSGSDNITGECTAGNIDAIPDIVPQYTTISDGNWSNKDIWVPTGGSTYPCPTGGPNGFVVNVNHVVTLDKSYCDAYKTYINKELRAVAPYFGHNLGTVYGNGTLYLESAVFPAGRFNAFLDCSGSATVEYGGSGNYDVTADLFSSIPKMKFSGTGSRILPNKDLTICKELKIDGPMLDNSINNRHLTILGTMLRTSGEFRSGSGANATVTFAGSLNQTIKDFNGDNAFNNLEINNSEGLALTGQIDVAGQLLLTNGLITTTSSNILKITNYSVNCVTPTGGRTSSYVNGPLMKKVNQGDPSFIYPVGKASYGLGDRFGLRATNPGTQYWVVEMFNPNPLNTYKAPLTGVNTKEYWTVSGVNNASAAFVEIGWNPSSDLTPLMTLNGASDMRVAEHDGTDWVEISSGATAGSNNNTGSVETSGRATLATGTRNYTLACKNAVKPRIRLAPTGPVCGTSGIPVVLTTTLPVDAPFTVYYTEGGIAKSINPTSFPATIPTVASGATYKLTGFAYKDSDDNDRTGVIDATPVVTYAVPKTAYAGDDISICGGSSAVLKGNDPTSSFTGLWSIVPVVSGTGGNVESPTVYNSNFTGKNGEGYTLCWTISSGACISTDTVKIKFPLLPAQPKPFIVATTPVCRGANGITYTVPNDPTATSYIWSYSGGGATIHSASTNSVTIDYDNAATTGILSVAITNDCGTSATRTLNIVVNSLPTVTIEQVSKLDDASPYTACAGGAINVQVKESGYTYSWSINDATYQLTDADKQGTGVTAPDNNTLFPDVASGTLKTPKVSVTVKDSNGCINTANQTLNFYRIPVTGPPYHVSNNVAK